MNTVQKLESVSQFNRIRGQRTDHPLVTVLDQSFSCQVKQQRMISDLYIIFLKEQICGEFLYGRNHYDYEEGTILCIGPGQVFGVNGGEKLLQPRGWALAFHPDFILGTKLGKTIRDYHFFSYTSNEALHLSEVEREIMVGLFKKIQFELNQAVDHHSKTILISNIELFLNYCNRYYDRQFITRDSFHKDKLAKLEEMLDEYFRSDKVQNLGLPTVGYLAEQFHLSANYFGDMVKKETGLSAKDYIQKKVISVAKEKVCNPDKTISEIAYDMGFIYPQHFSRLFKEHVGQSPVEYRSLNQYLVAFEKSPKSKLLGN